jgi:hypothetical protein
MFGQFDEDNEERYPSEGSLEEKAVFSLEQLRTQFYWQKRTYEATKEGGARYNATRIAVGPKTADRMAKTAEAGFANFLKQAYLTKDGETTDPKYPVDKMINTELRRIRSVIILNVSQYMDQFTLMMPENIMTWNSGTIYHNLSSYKYRYYDTVYDDINTIIPNKKMPPRSVADLDDMIDKLATKYSDKNILAGASHAFITDRIRDELIEFLLVDIPYNNKKLEDKPLIADEMVPKEADTKPVLH